MTPAKLANLDEIDFEGIISQLEGIKRRFKKLKHKHNKHSLKKTNDHTLKFDTYNSQLSEL